MGEPNSIEEVTIAEFRSAPISHGLNLAFGIATIPAKIGWPVLALTARNMQAKKIRLTSHRVIFTNPITGKPLAEAALRDVTEVRCEKFMFGIGAIEVVSKPSPTTTETIRFEFVRNPQTVVDAILAECQKAKQSPWSFGLGAESPVDRVETKEEPPSRFKFWKKK